MRIFMNSQNPCSYQKIENQNAKIIPDDDPRFQDCRVLSRPLAAHDAFRNLATKTAVALGALDNSERQSRKVNL
jgi:hypothetical protein